MTSQLVCRYKHLVIEDLNVRGMMQGSTPKAQAYAAMGAIRRKLEYKAPWHHCHLSLAHRLYPSSKTCSNCQQVNAKLKRERYWQCPRCAATHERNINAAVNLQPVDPPRRQRGDAPRREGPGRQQHCRWNRPGRPENSTAGPSGPATLTVCG